MLISGHVTLGNDSCNKIARQVARKIAWWNSAFMRPNLPTTLVGSMAWANLHVKI